MNKKDYGKLALKAAIIFGVLGIIIPFAFKYMIFENTALSNLNNAEWASFLGSYVGGIFGGIGTLIAVLITVKSSQQIQEENKKDTDQRIIEETIRHQQDINNELKRRDEERTAEICEKQKHDRTIFANDLADKIGIYITHISKYHYSSQRAEHLNESLLRAKADLIEAEKEVEDLGKELTKLSTENTDEFLRLSVNKDLAQDKCDNARRVYQEADCAYRDNMMFGQRLEANEAYFIIKTKLFGIKEAEKLVTELENIHRGAGFPHHEEKSYGSWIDEESKNLMDEYRKFKEQYIKGALYIAT